MKVIKKLNNNVVIAVDGDGRELVVIGRGVGFEKKIPYELTDLSKVDRTFYDLDKSKLHALEDIPEVYIDIASKIIQIARDRIKCEFNPNVILTLSDHLSFAVKRLEDKIDIKNPLAYDIEHIYSKEVAIGYKALKYIKEKIGVELPKDEAASIALHLVNAETQNGNLDKTIQKTKILKDITEIVSTMLDVNIDENGYFYSRFIMHIRYLLERQNKEQIVSSENVKLFDMMIAQYPETYKCCMRIEEYFYKRLNWKCSDEELLYLMLHINRLYGKEK